MLRFKYESNVAVHRANFSIAVFYTLFSKNLVPRHFYLSPKEKSALIGIRFESVVKGKAASCVLKELTENDFHHSMEHLEDSLVAW